MNVATVVFKAICYNGYNTAILRKLILKTSYISFYMLMF